MLDPKIIVICVAGFYSIYGLIKLCDHLEIKAKQKDALR